MKRAWIVLAACAVLAGGVCADELHLKDGTVLNGTIVGFDENSFKVKTNYGYAIVRRDQVVSIEVRDPDADANAAKKPDPNAKPPAPAPTGSTFPSANGAPATPPAPHHQSAVVSPTSATNSAPPAATSSTAAAKTEPVYQPSTGKPNPPANSSSAPINAPAIVNANNSRPPAATYGAEAAPPPASIKPTKTMMEPPKMRSAPAATTAKPPAIAANAPGPTPAAATAAALPTIPKPTPPEPIRESIDGNTYTNATYGFQMFRPPGWDIIADARTTLPGAIAALGTSDQTTYLLIGASPSAGTLDADLKASDRKLNEMVENYRPLGDKSSTVSGFPAVERKFRGAVDGKDWSGTVVLIQRGKILYTVFGMTYAGTDLVQIQENVIHRAITSLKFAR
jgi:hypothetical protein